MGHTSWDKSAKSLFLDHRIPEQSHFQKQMRNVDLFYWRVEEIPERGKIISLEKIRSTYQSSSRTSMTIFGWTSQYIS